jgi:hypothetical protein
MMPRVPPGSPKPWAHGATAVYHITHVDNLASMAQTGVIRCDRGCSAQGIRPVSIAYAGLKARRADWHVKVARRGTLADYVPFYYAPRSPMLYAINGGFVAGYEEGQAEVAHLVLAAEDIAAPGTFAITDGHAATPLTTQYEDLRDLEKISWPIMHEKYWRDTDDDGDRKRRRQAEFLVWSAVPFEAVRVIGVMTATIAERVHAALADSAHTPSVVVRSDWYY